MKRNYRLALLGICFSGVATMVYASADAQQERRTNIKKLFAVHPPNNAEAKNSWFLLVTWFIKNHPRDPVHQTQLVHETGVVHHKLANRDDFEKLADLWDHQVAHNQRDAVIIGHAGMFNIAGDLSKATFLLQRAVELDGENPLWPEQLAVACRRLADDSDGQKRLAYLRKAAFYIERTISLSKDGVDNLELRLARVSIDLGTFERAHKIADKLINAKTPSKWHKGKIIYGLVAIRKGNVKSAKTYLLESIPPKSDHDLGSFGPDMSLADALLKSDEKTSVLSYLKACRRVWPSGGKRLEKWIRRIESGRQPDFLRQLFIVN